MTQNTSPVLAGVQTIFAVPRNLWLATSGAVGGEYRKTETRSLLPVSARCREGAWEKGEGVGGTGKPVFHLHLKPFILRTPKKLVFGSYGSGWFHTCSSLFLECPSLLSTPSHFSICLLLLIRSQLQKKIFFSCFRGALSSPQRKWTVLWSKLRWYTRVEHVWGSDCAASDTDWCPTLGTHSAWHLIHSVHLNAVKLNSPVTISVWCYLASERVTKIDFWGKTKETNASLSLWGFIHSLVRLSQGSAQVS